MWVSLPDLADILGREMAGVLSRARGGVEMYVPHTAVATHDLARIVGMQGMQALGAEFGGKYITVPNGRFEPHKATVLRMLEEGRTKKDIALECGVTERYVYYVVNRFSPRQRQLSLL